MLSERQRELLPHYVAITLLTVLVLGGLRVTLGDPGVLVDLAAVIAIVLAYPSVVRVLGLEPSSWDRR
jgi:DNA-binding cell septation regulator SpoVG